MGNLQPEGAALERVPTAGSIRGAAYLAARIDLYAEIAGRRTRSQVLVGKNVVLDVPVAFMKDREIDRVECDSQDIMFRDGHVHYAGQMDIIRGKEQVGRNIRSQLCRTHPGWPEHSQSTVSHSPPCWPV